MWERWRQSVVGRHHDDRRPRPPGGPADLARLPALPAGAPGGLAAIDPAVMTRYLGLPVAQVERLAGPATDGTAVPQQGADRQGRQRTDEQTALDRSAARQLAADQQGNGWQVTFTNGLQASVQVLASNDQRNAFGWMRTRYRAAHGADDDEAESLTQDRIGTVTHAPYETYYEGGVLTAHGREHDVLVKSSAIGAPRLHDTMAGLAALGLRVVEG